MIFLSVVVQEKKNKTNKKQFYERRQFFALFVSYDSTGAHVEMGRYGAHTRRLAEGDRLIKNLRFVLMCLTIRSYLVYSEPSPIGFRTEQSGSRPTAEYDVNSTFCVGFDKEKTTKEMIKVLQKLLFLRFYTILSVIGFGLSEYKLHII